MHIQAEDAGSARHLVRFAIAILCGSVFQGLDPGSRNMATGDELSPSQPRPIFECRWTSDTITIDGRASEPGWQLAEMIDGFGLSWLSPEAPPAKASTRAKLLWDRESIYFFAELDDQDLFADVTEHDGMTWLNDVFELFLKPAADKPGYYEVHVNPANTRMDMYVPRREPYSYFRFKSKRPFHFESAVTVNGTLENRTDVDRGWTVEGQIPWRDFIDTGGRPAVNEVWRFAICRYDYTAGTKPELSTCAPLSKADFHQHENYADLQFVGPPSMSDALPPRIPWMTSRVVGSPDPPKPFRIVRAFPKLDVDQPICVKPIPGTDRMLLIHSDGDFQPTRLLMFSAHEDVDSYEILMDRTESERVAYDIAFHPKFSNNGYVFLGLNERDARQGKITRIVRYRMQPIAPYTFDTQEDEIIIEWPSDGHNGGAIAFGADGMLYATSGDGTSESDTDLAGQHLDHLLSKVLRIDVDHPDEGRAYSVPPDNPFVGVSGVRPETWAFGFRNPWRIAADLQTGQIWVGNNGQDLWEQVYLVQRGANYGWSAYEGSHPFYLERQNGSVPVSQPAFEHHHAEFRSLTGGSVYRGTGFPELVGAYIYGDYSTGKLWAGKHDGDKVVWQQELADTTARITCIASDHRGELLIANHNKVADGGGLFRLERNFTSNVVSSFPRQLSETGLFRSVADHEVEPGVIEYSVNVPGWHDGAIGKRFLGLPAAPNNHGQPEGSMIEFQPQSVWSFPEGTVLAQSLAVVSEVGVAASRRWVETRLLTRRDGDWTGYTYLWNDEQTDATLVDDLGTTKTYEVHEAGVISQRTWHVPSRSECLSCHSRQAGFVLGMTTPQLNRTHAYGAVQVNQLALFEYWGILHLRWEPEARQAWIDELRLDYSQPTSQEVWRNMEASIQNRIADFSDAADQRPPPPTSMLYQAPEKYDRLVRADDEQASLRDRARAYLQVNCAGCHLTNGGGNARINLDYKLNDNLINLINAKPLHATYGISDASLIAPGAPHRSVLNYRMSTLVGGRMPRVGSHQVDRAGVKLLRRWIAELDDPSPSESDSGEPRPPSADLRRRVAVLATADASVAIALSTELMSSTSGALALVEALDEHQFSDELSDAIVRTGSMHSDPVIQHLFECYLPEAQRAIRLGPNIDSEQILQLSGSAVRGKHLLLNSTSLTCRQCHRYEGQGHAVGPDLAQSDKKLTRAELLESLIFPSKTIADKFVTYLVATRDGKIYTGLIATISDSEIVLKEPGGKEIHIPRGHIEEMIPQSKSLMPDQLLKDFTAQEAADLLDYLHSLRQTKSVSSTSRNDEQTPGSGTDTGPASP